MGYKTASFWSIVLYYPNSFLHSFYDYLVCLSDWTNLCSYYSWSSGSQFYLKNNKWGIPYLRLVQGKWNTYRSSFCTSGYKISVWYARRNEWRRVEYL